MAIVKTDDKHYKDMAEVLRGVLETNDKYKPNEMANKIEQVYAKGNTDGHRSGYEEGEYVGFTAGQEEGYNNGYSQGKTDGQTEGYNTGYAEGSALKDNAPYINASGVTSLAYWFCGATLSNITCNNNQNPIEWLKNIDTSIVTNWNRTFSNNTSFTELPYVNADNAETSNATFYGCMSMVTAPKFNFAKSVTAYTCFAWCNKMVTIPTPIDFSNVTSLSDTFAQCSVLQNVRFVEGTTKVNISFGSSPKLTLDSLKSIINGLCDYSGTENEGVYKLTLHANSKALLETEGATAPNGLTWLEYISAKGWTY